MKSKGKRPPIVLYGISAALTLLVCATLLEGGLRLFLGGDRFFPYYPNSVRLSYPSEEITPGVAGVSRFSANSYGTRGREPSGHERLRILTLGGSTTADTVLDDEETWSALLELRLGDLLGDRDLVWVANSGIDGHNLHHHLMHAKYLLPRLPPMDFVIVHAGINDMGGWFHARTFDPNYLDEPANWDSRVGEAFRWSRYTPADWPLFKRTETWKTLSWLKDRYLSAQARSASREIVQDAELHWLEEERRRRNERVAKLLPEAKLATLPVALDAYGRMISRVAGEILSQGSTPVLMAQAIQTVFQSDAERKRLWMGELADGGYVTEDQYPLILDRFNARMLEVARERDLLAIDLPTRIERDASLYYDGMHLNERGARAVADSLAAFFEENGLLEPYRDPR